MARSSWLAALALGGVVLACTSTTNGVVGPGSGTLPNGGAGDLGGSGGSSGGGGEAGACAPADESGYTLAWHAPHPHTASCDGAQLDSLFTCIRDASQATSGTPASCAPWSKSMSTANRACYECVFTDDTQPARGPIVVHSTQHTQETNFAGCVAIAEGKLDGSGCAGAVAAEVGCDNAACTVSCPVDSTGAGLAALNDCLDAAQQGTCARFFAPAQCISADTGPLAPCDPFNYADADPLAATQAVAGVFCGGGTGQISDAGGD